MRGTLLLTTLVLGTGLSAMVQAGVGDPFYERYVHPMRTQFRHQSPGTFHEAEALAFLDRVERTLARVAPVDLFRSPEMARSWIVGETAGERPSYRLATVWSGTRRVLSDLWLRYSQTRRYRDCETLAKRWARIATTLFGPEDHEVTWAVSKLMSAYYWQRKMDAHQEAAEQVRSRYGRYYREQKEYLDLPGAPRVDARIWRQVPPAYRGAASRRFDPRRFPALVD